MPMPDSDRVKRLKIRSWRRGIREMDLILGPWFDREGANLSEAELDHYEALLEENDQALYAWVSGREKPPETFADLVARLRP